MRDFLRYNKRTFIIFSPIMAEKIDPGLKKRIPWCHSHWQIAENPLLRFVGAMVLLLSAAAATINTAYAAPVSSLRGHIVGSLRNQHSAASVRFTYFKAMDRLGCAEYLDDKLYHDTFIMMISAPSFILRPWRGKETRPNSPVHLPPTLPLLRVRRRFSAKVMATFPSTRSTSTRFGTHRTSAFSGLDECTRTPAKMARSGYDPSGRVQPRAAGPLVQYQRTWHLVCR